MSAGPKQSVGLVLSRIASRAGDQRVAFLVALGFFLALQLWYGAPELRFDAAQYWELAGDMRQLHFPASIRGYLLPLLLAPAHALDASLGTTGRWGFRLASSAVYAWLLTGPLPNAFLVLQGGQLSLARRLVGPLLLALVMPGVLLYPLSDLPSAVLAILGLSWVLRSLASGRLVFALAAGLALSAAYNIRTVYLLTLVTGGLLVVVAHASRHGAGTACRVALLFMLGAACIALPQALINQATQGRFTPMVQAVDPDGRPLMAAQLRWGITLQKYETTVRPNAPAPSVFYLDPAGVQIFQSAGVADMPVTIGSYLQLVLAHPLDFAGLYARHLVNALDVRDGRVYTTRDSRDRHGAALANALLLLLGLASVLARAWRSQSLLSAARLAAIAALLLPVAAILPGAVETRFLLMVHLLLHASLATGGSRSLWPAGSTARWMVLLSAAVCLAGMLAISTNTMSQQAYDWSRVFR